MDINKIKSFFDFHAATWDDHQERKEDVIDFILEKSDVREGSRVLDVATGTGVLIGDYLYRGAKVTGIDISDEMIRVASGKFSEARFVCADAQSYRFDESFDVIVVYNAFPHFSDRDSLFENLVSMLEDGGRLTVAHGMSEKQLRECHSGSAREISTELPCKEELAKLMSRYLEVDIMLSDDRMYMVSGKKIKKM